MQYIKLGNNSSSSNSSNSITTTTMSNYKEIAMREDISTMINRIRNVQCAITGKGNKDLRVYCTNCRDKVSSSNESVLIGFLQQHSRCSTFIQPLMYSSK